MPANQVLNPRQSRTIETPVREIAVPVGKVIVTGDISKGDSESIIGIEAGESHVFDPPVAGLTVFAPEGGARLSVYYHDEEGAPSAAPPAASRKRVRRNRPKAAAKRAKPQSKSKSPKPSAAKTSKKASRAKTTSRKR
jgi:hypothetical protein